VKKVQVSGLQGYFVVSSYERAGHACFSPTSFKGSKLLSAFNRDSVSQAGEVVGRVAEMGITHNYGKFGQFQCAWYVKVGTYESEFVASLELLPRAQCVFLVRLSMFLDSLGALAT
jgi:hypothetical protein